MDLVTLVAVIVGLAFGVLATLRAVAYRRSKRMEGKALEAFGADVPPEIPRQGQALLYFYSPTCGACRTMTPTVDALLADDLKVVKLDVTKSPDVARTFAVMGTPTTLLLEHGTIRNVLLGARSETELRGLFG
jgi:thioredoxin 1